MTWSYGMKHCLPLLVLLCSCATAVERVSQDVSYLAAPGLDGRGIGTPGLERAGDYIEARFDGLRLKPAGDSGTFRQAFPVTTAVKIGPGTRVTLGDSALPGDAYTVLGFSARSVAQGPMVLAGYGIVEPSLGVDDYAKLDVKEKIVVVRRFVPDTPTFSETEKQRRHGDLRHKAWTARERGAKALIVVDWPEAPSPPVKDWQPPSEASLPAPVSEGPGDVGIPVVMVKRAALEPHMGLLAEGKSVDARVEVQLELRAEPGVQRRGHARSGRGQAAGSDRDRCSLRSPGLRRAPLADAGQAGAARGRG